MTEITHYRMTNFHDVAMTQAYNEGVKARREGDNRNPYSFGDTMDAQTEAWNWGFWGHEQALTDRLEADKKEADEERFERVAKKGHDCDEHSEHRRGGRLGDYYECGRCGELLQVG